MGSFVLQVLLVKVLIPQALATTQNALRTVLAPSLERRHVKRAQGFVYPGRVKQPQWTQTVLTSLLTATLLTNVKSKAALLLKNAEVYCVQEELDKISVSSVAPMPLVRRLVRLITVEVTAAVLLNSAWEPVPIHYQQITVHFTTKLVSQDSAKTLLVLLLTLLLTPTAELPYARITYVSPVMLPELLLNRMRFAMDLMPLNTAILALVHALSKLA